MASNPQLRAIRQQKLDDQHASDLSITAWCVQHGLHIVVYVFAYF